MGSISWQALHESVYTFSKVGLPSTTNSGKAPALPPRSNKKDKTAATINTATT
jgi:hypothetical protein